VSPGVSSHCSSVKRPGKLLLPGIDDSPNY
jgi:hypothetical protein